MLHIIYGDIEADNYIFNPDAYFNNTYEDEFEIEIVNTNQVVRSMKELNEAVLDNHLI